MKYQRVKRLQGFFTRRVYTHYKEDGMDELFNFYRTMYGRHMTPSPHKRLPYIQLIRHYGYHKVHNPYFNNRLLDAKSKYYAYYPPKRRKRPLCSNHFPLKGDMTCLP